MQSIRCRCGKIVCQVANVPALPVIDEATQSLQGPSAVILCRHCKRFVVLRFPSLTSISVASDLSQSKERSLVTT
ncbi:MAG: hypothetical protein ACOY94_23695 [Bacillota bacterium]